MTPEGSVDGRDAPRRTRRRKDRQGMPEELARNAGRIDSRTGRAAPDTPRTRHGKDRRVTPIGLERKNWFKMTCNIVYATNRDGWAREGGCHGWIRVTGFLDRTPTLKMTNCHVSMAASRELDRTAPVDPERTARLACPGSPHRNAVSADYKVPRSTESGHS